MAKIAGVVAPGLPHHVAQRNNRRQQTFFCVDDYRTYLGLMAQRCSHCAWAREGPGPQPLQAKTRAKTQPKNQISIVSPELLIARIRRIEAGNIGKSRKLTKVKTTSLSGVAFSVIYLFLKSSSQLKIFSKSSSILSGSGIETGVSSGWECSYLEYNVR